MSIETEIAAVMETPPYPAKSAPAILAAIIGAEPTATIKIVREILIAKYDVLGRDYFIHPKQDAHPELKALKEAFAVFVDDPSAGNYTALTNAMTAYQSA